MLIRGGTRCVPVAQLGASNIVNRLIERGARHYRRLFLLSLLPWALGHALSAAAQGTLKLEQAVALAQQNDPWLQGSKQRQLSVEAQSVSAGSLPDPMVSVGFANLPTDTFDFDQEAMTQFKVGVSQVFPRGDSRDLRQKQLALEARQHPHLRAQRRAQVAVEVSDLWLEAFRAAETIRLIEQDRNLFEHLVDVAESSYASARGGARQQDLIRAQLELTRLEDRLTRLDQQYAVAASRLGQWLQPLSLAYPELLQDADATGLAQQFSKHPTLQSLEQRIAASETRVSLAEQKYKPQWQLSASYGYRDDDPMGRDRADFFSVGVAFDLPLFTSRRQDQQVQSAVADSEATRTDRALELRRMLAEFDTQRSRLARLESRRQLYESRLLQEMQEQAEASLTAYTNDEGDFAEVVRARIDVLNTRIEALDIEVDRLKTISRLNYFFVESSLEEQEVQP
jgi:outer membrane protein TolC